MTELLFVALFQAVTGAPADAPAAADPPAQQQQQQQQQQTQDPRQVRRCRAIAPTGTRFATERLCISEQEQEDLYEKNQHDMREIRSRAIQGTSG